MAVLPFLSMGVTALFQEAQKSVFCVVLCLKRSGHSAPHSQEDAVPTSIRRAVGLRPASTLPFEALCCQKRRSQGARGRISTRESGSAAQ